MNKKLINFEKKLKEFVFNYRIKNHDQAKKNANLLFKQHPSNVGLFITVGVLFLQNKKYEDAIKVFQKAISLNPKDVNTYHNLGIAWTQLNNIDEAIACYSKAEKLDSKNSLTYYNYGVLCSKKLEYKKARDKSNKAIKLNSNVSKYYYNLAEYLTKLGEYEKAINNYKKIITIDPNHLRAKYNLSRLQLATENFKEGWENFHLRFEYSETKYSPQIKNLLNLNQWNGEKFNGTLYVYCEQGIGDHILHSSMINDLSKIHSDICLIVDKRLENLFKRSFQFIKVSIFNPNNKFNNNDRHVLLASLGKILRKSLNDFAEPPKPFIIPNNKNFLQYRNLLSSLNKIKIGHILENHWCK